MPITNAQATHAQGISQWSH